MSFGIDISYAQKGLNWDEIALKCDFVMIKASQGNYSVGSGQYTNDRKPFADSMLVSHVTECIRRGIPFGFYHFLIAETVAQAEEEALFFCETIAPYACQTKTPLFQAVDLEYNPIEEQYRSNSSALNARIRVFCDTVRAYGAARNSSQYYKPMVYTNPDYLRNRNVTVPDGAELWLASWVNTSGNGYKNGYFAKNTEKRAEEIETLFANRYSPTYGCTFWQYGYELHGLQSGTGGSIDGVYSASEIFSKGAKTTRRGTRYYKTADLLTVGEALNADSQTYISLQGTFLAEKTGIDSIYGTISAYDELVARFAVSDDVNSSSPRLLINIELADKTETNTETAKTEEGDRIEARFFIDGAEKTNVIQPYLCSLDFTDVHGGTGDTLSFTLYDTDGIWQQEDGMGAFLESPLPIGVLLEKRVDGVTSLLNMGTFYPASVTSESTVGTITVNCVSCMQNSYVKQPFTKTWYNVTVADIAKEICRQAGIRFYDERKNTGQEVRFGTIIQRMQSPALFLNEVAATVGADVKISNGGIVLQDLWSVQYDTVTISKPDCLKYRMSSKVYGSAYSSVSVGHTGVGSVYQGAYASPYTGGKTKQYDFNVACVAIGGNDYANTIAENITERLNEDAVSAEITVTGTPKLVCGCGVRLDGFGYFSGEYTVKSARHRLDKSGYRTTVELVGGS